MAKTWKAKIKLKSGIQEVSIQAGTYQNAKEMLEDQYGKGCIQFGPVAVLGPNK
jgi:hypothetical protein